MSHISRRSLLAAGAAAAVRPLLCGEEVTWKSEPPAGCPFPSSTSLKSIVFTGRSAHYTTADTWYPSWASDGLLYSPWTDGKVNEMSCNSNGPDAHTGHATIQGDDPLKLEIRDYHTYRGSPAPYGGRYPCGSLVFNGVWYYGTYCLMDSDGDAAKGLNWDILGPFVGFRTSRDFGKTWTDTTHTPQKPLFGEPAKPGGALKIGAPHFVDFGRNMQFSPDGKAYLVAHGAEASDGSLRPANLSWITGDQLYLLRFEPSPANANDRLAYEFWDGHTWSRDLAKARPAAEWNNNAGCVTVTYNAPLKRYLMCVTDGGNTISRMNTYILESDRLTGPWRMVVYMKHFGEQAYFVNIPSKFISPDGRTMWLCYSANFTNGYLNTGFAARPEGSRYGMHLVEIRLV